MPAVMHFVYRKVSHFGQNMKLMSKPVNPDRSVNTMQKIWFIFFPISTDLFLLEIDQKKPGSRSITPSNPLTPNQHEPGLRLALLVSYRRFMILLQPAATGCNAGGRHGK
jgi:hypothetical protein